MLHANVEIASNVVYCVSSEWPSSMALNITELFKFHSSFMYKLRYEYVLLFCPEQIGDHIRLPIQCLWQTCKISPVPPFYCTLN